MLLRWYLSQLKNRPLLTSMWSTGSLLCAGDVIAQQLIEKRGAAHDWVRTGRMTLIGVACIGPTLRTWYVTLDKVFGSSMLISTAARKLCADQLVFAPLFIVVFITLNNVLQGNTLTTVSRQLRQDYTNIVLTNWLVWVPGQILNFSLVPVQHRLMFANVLALFWNTYLSYKANSGDTVQSEGKLEPEL